MKEIKPKVGAAMLHNFEEGNEIGELARTLFEDGILIEAEPWEREQAAQATASVMRSGANVIFEASSMADGLFARVDVLRKEEGRIDWELIEVKKSAKLNEEHLEDVAL